MGAPLTEGKAENADTMKKPASAAAAVDETTNTTPLQTYINLIQQYLSVFMLENAVWLAERCVAEYPTSTDGVYLLALCHYRAGHKKAARLVLESSLATTTTTPGPSSRGTGTTASGSAAVAAAATDYLAAVCSYDLKDYHRAEEALLKSCRSLYKQNQRNSMTTTAAPVESSSTTGASSSVSSMDEWILSTTPCPIPNGAAGLALLGKICRQSNRKARAVQYFRMSLQLDPFLWTSFEALSELGAENVEASEIFGVRSGAGAAGGNGSSATISGGGTLSSYTNTSTALQAKTPLQPMETPGAPAMSMSQMALRPNTMTTTAPRPNRLVRFDTPGLTPIPVNASMLPAETPVTATAPLMMSHNNNQNKAAATTTADQSAVLRRAAQVAARQYYPPSPETPMTTVTRSMRYLRGIVGEAEQQEQQPGEQGGSGSGGGGRNLFLASENQASNQAVFASGGGGGGPAPSHHHHHHHHHQADEDVSLEKPPAREKEPPTSKVHEILELLCTAGTAYQHLCQYRCKEALRAFQALPVRHQMTGWALHQQGRAHLELNEFAPAQRCLEFMQSKEPSRMRGLELLSTVYWHLKKEVELSHLAQRVVDWDRTAPEAWCVVGNCFSLQKDHETALVFFGRSLQLNPDFTYTHTLSGYEYMANEDFEKAITCFRQALRTDDRHYNAWYGLGAIYHRQEKFDLAEYHFQRAVAIHPTSSVLRCNLGISQYANGKAYVALDTLAEAFRLDPQNPQARFQRATIYTALHRPAEALEELKKVRDAAPREATVHFALGKVLKRLGRPDLAMKCFLTAMDLDPKDNQMIKSAMDKLDEPDVDEETMAAF